MFFVPPGDDFNRDKATEALMRDRKQKDKTVSFGKASLLRRFFFSGILIVVSMLVIVGTSTVLRRSSNFRMLDRLPDIPNLDHVNETLKQEIVEANRVVKEAIENGSRDYLLGGEVGHLGKLYQANHYYDEAIACYKLAMELEGKNPRWSYFLAIVHEQRGENKSEIDLLEKTINKDPSYSPALLKLADSYFKTGQIEKARSYYMHRLDLSPGDPYALLGLARIALGKSDWGLARSYLGKAIESNPKFGDAHRMLATVYTQLGESLKAKKSLDRAAQCTRFRPSPDPWVESLCDLCYDTDQLLVLGSKAIIDLDIKKALDFFHRARKVDPENSKVQVALGKAYFMMGREKLARKFLKNTLDLDPRSDEAYFYLGLILRNEKKFEDAEKMFFKALEFQSNNANVYNNLGVTFLEQHKFRKAIQYFRQAIKLYPEHLEALYNLGVALWASGDRRAAMKQYYHVLQMKPEWSRAANSLAWILATDKDDRIRNGKEAVKWALTACKGEGRKNPEYLDTLAAAYAEAGLFEKAVETAEKCLELAQSLGDTDFVRETQQRLLLYRSERTFSE